ncbi:hypothetical protein [Acidiluteibacter ferrifornacis]|uniref:Uncharacterized protein n=1 Tax=Acidiluteibacter ferrifornacis TaxID=2692424 RepID=A0A6N9NIM0_9FLAO|nr:hypothetical protein [Acidiluteibacter ferrifornacis]NBG65694.1 hypothetical protein [Acidiluteibacter ferrifornacis]
MKKTWIYLVAVLFPFIGICQQIPDSVTVFIDNRIEVVIELDDYIKLKENNDAATIVKKFQAQLPKIINELQLDKSEIVTYINDSLLTIEDGEQRKVFLNTESSLINTGVRDKAILRYKGLEITISTNDLEIILDIDMAKCVQMVVDSLPEKSRLSRSLFFQIIDSKVIEIDGQNRKNSYNDVLALQMGTGISLLKNTSLVDLTFSMDFIFYKKGKISHNGYVSTNLMYDFVNNREMNINTFLNIGYRSYYFNKEDEEHFVGLEFGYLVSRQGDLFDKNTFRFGLSKSINSHFTFSSQLYMEDNFKRFYPGVRLDIKF